MYQKWENNPGTLTAQSNEDEIVSILKSTLKGLHYLCFMRKIHRDMKAGNIVSDKKGHAKLAGSGLEGHKTLRFSSTVPSTL